MFLKISVIRRSKCFLRVSYFRQNWWKMDKNGLKSPKNRRKMEKVSDGSPMFLIVVFLIKKACIISPHLSDSEALNHFPTELPTKLSIFFLG